MKELSFLQELKSVTFSTVENGIPHARIADVMLIEDDKIYFLSARGKAFYKQLMNNKHVALVGMGKQFRTVRISGIAEPADCTYVDRIFEQNPDLNNIYAQNQRDILEAFCISKGVGEIFDLSSAPPKRERFAFGGAKIVTPGYSIINDNCIKCKVCVMSCPVSAVKEEDEKLSIDSTLCLECGRCYEFCPVQAIEQPKKFIMEE